MKTENAFEVEEEWIVCKKCNTPTPSFVLLRLSKEEKVQCKIDMCQNCFQPL